MTSELRDRDEYGDPEPDNWHPLMDWGDVSAIFERHGYHGGMGSFALATILGGLEAELATLAVTIGERDRLIGRLGAQVAGRDALLAQLQFAEHLRKQCIAERDDLAAELAQVRAWQPLKTATYQDPTGVVAITFHEQIMTLLVKSHGLVQVRLREDDRLCRRVE